MAGAPKGQKRVTKALAAEFNSADDTARAELLSQFATYGKSSEAEFQEALTAKFAQPTTSPVAAPAGTSRAWVKQAATLTSYDDLPMQQITTIRDAAQAAIGAFAEREKAKKLREIEELEQRLQQLKSEI